jgi:hypothetical protein
VDMASGDLPSGKALIWSFKKLCIVFGQARL